MKIRLMPAGGTPMAKRAPMSLIFSMTIRISTVMIFNAATRTMSPTAMLMSSFSRFRAEKKVRFMATRSFTK